jgi:hypothetical protein
VSTDKSGHRNHVGIGIDRKTYNKLRKLAKNRDISMREMVKQMVSALNE